VTDLNDLGLPLVSGNFEILVDGTSVALCPEWFSDGVLRREVRGASGARAREVEGHGAVSGRAEWPHRAGVRSTHHPNLMDDVIPSVSEGSSVQFSWQATSDGE
jgi:hypothetical protein